MLDTDIGLLASLQPVWEALEKGSIAITPHMSEPPSIDISLNLEGNFMKCGLFNAGVVAMKKSPEAERISRWMASRLERFGHDHGARRTKGLPGSYDFEFVDQVWLSFLPLYFPEETLVLRHPKFNLGHWNLHQGELTRRDGVAYFNNQKVVVAHFSGLPDRQRHEMISAHSSLYLDRPSQEWAAMAGDYLDRLENMKKVTQSIPYSYANIPPSKVTQEAKSLSPPLTIQQSSIPKEVFRKLVRSLKSPDKVLGVLKLVSWRIQRTCQEAHSILINRGEDRIFRDQSPNGFTGLIPCIGNYETYLVRSWILQAVEQAKQRFHGKLLDVGAGSSPYEDLIMANGKVSEYIKLDFASSDYHKGHDLDLTWDGKTIPLDRHSIDSVIMTEVLEHVHRPGELLQEVRKEEQTEQMIGRVNDLLDIFTIGTAAENIHGLRTRSLKIRSGSLRPKIGEGQQACSPGRDRKARNLVLVLRRIAVHGRRGGHDVRVKSAPARPRICERPRERGKL
jgi:hypothetical protein